MAKDDIFYALNPRAPAARAALFGHAGTRGRGHTVLLAGAAAGADRTNDLAVDGDGDAPLRGHRRLRKRQERSVTGGVLVRKDLGGTPIDGGGARLALRNVRRRGLGAVHLLEIDELAGRADDGERHAPVVLLGLGKGGGRDRLGLLVVD